MGVNLILLQTGQRSGPAEWGLLSYLRKEILSFRLASGVVKAKVISEAIWIAVYVGCEIKSVQTIVLNNLKPRQ